MNTKPLVSVIIPIFKVEQYLSRCVDSVIEQTYMNLEIILVDDGSPDRCPEICDEYALKDSRIKVIHKPNGGLSDARNAGIEIAKGGYLSFVDSDDVVHSQMIEYLMKPLIENNELKISECRFKRFESDQELIGYVPNIKESIVFPYRLYFLKRNLTVAWGKIFEKSLFERVKFPYGRLHEDEFTTYKLIYDARSVSCTDSQLYLYRQRKGSIISSFTINRICDLHDALKNKFMFFISINDFQIFSKHFRIFTGTYCTLKKNRFFKTEFVNILEKWKQEIYTYNIYNKKLTNKLQILCMVKFWGVRNIIDDLIQLAKKICRYS